MLHALTQKYLEPHRKYHTLTHVSKMLKTASELDIQLDEAMTWAIWCHDVVYKIPANPGDNEEESAEFCAYYMEEYGLSNDVVLKAQSLIRATGYVLSDRIPELTKDQWIIVGLDLYGFASRGHYESAAVLIREERSDLRDEQWRRYRSELLNKLRNRPYIIYPTFFGNEHDYHAWHEQAWRNMDNELQELE